MIHQVATLLAHFLHEGELVACVDRDAASMFLSSFLSASLYRTKFTWCNLPHPQEYIYLRGHDNNVKKKSFGYTLSRLSFLSLPSLTGDFTKVVIAKL